MSSMKPGLTGILQILRALIEVGGREFCWFWHFGPILQVSNLRTIPSTGSYARQTGNVIGDGLTSRAPDPHRSPNVFMAYRAAA